MNSRPWLNRLHPQFEAGKPDSNFASSVPTAAERELKGPGPVEQLAASGVFTNFENGMLLVACSGGRDSVALLLAASELLQDSDFLTRFSDPPSLFCWHFDHGLRESSAEDARFVVELCNSLGIESHVDRRAAGPDVKDSEDSARSDRYSALMQFIAGLSSKSGRTVRALTAHHLGDHAATVLFNIVRGTHLRGLRGIAAELDGWLFRPWLKLSRQHIEHFLSEKQQSYVEDESNKMLSYSRNRMNESVLPQLNEINSSALEHIARLARSAQTFARYMDLALDVQAEQRFNIEQMAPSLPLLALPATGYEFLLQEKGWLQTHMLAEFAGRELTRRGVKMDYPAFENLRDWAEAGGDWLELTDHRLRLALSTIFIVEDRSRADAVGEAMFLRIRVTPACNSDLSRSNIGSSDRIEDWFQFLLAYSAGLIQAEKSWSCFLPADLPQPLRMRTMRTGDRMVLPNGSGRKLGDIFTDAKIPLALRPCWVVLVDANDEVLWLPALADGQQMARARETQDLVLVELSRPVYNLRA